MFGLMGLMLGTAHAGGSVCVDGGGCHATLQAAIDASFVDDTIVVSDTELREIITVPHALTIRGAGPSATILSPAASTSPTISVQSGASLTLEGFRINATTVEAARVTTGGTLSLRGVEVATSSFTDPATTLIIADLVTSLQLDDVAFLTNVPIASAVRASGELAAVDVTITAGQFDGAVFSAEAGSGPWSLTDVSFSDVRAVGPALEILDRDTVRLRRVMTRCLQTNGPAIVVRSPGAAIGPLLVWKGNADPLLDLAGAGELSFATLVSGGVGVHLAGSWAVSHTAVQSDTAFVGVAGSTVTARYNVYDVTTAATGALSAPDVGGEAVVLDRIDFVSFAPESSCAADILAPVIGGSLLDAGDPTLFDRDGSRADIGSTGGLDGFELLLDVDGDGYANAVDCDDEDATSHPNGDDIAHDGVDQDCDGRDSLDGDGDGYDADFAGGDDCDDGDPLVNPGAVDPRGDDDLNCDGFSGPSTSIELATCSHGAQPASTGLFFLLNLYFLRRRAPRTVHVHPAS